MYDRGDYNSSFALRAVELKNDKINLFHWCKQEQNGGTVTMQLTQITCFFLIKASGRNIELRV